MTQKESARKGIVTLEMHSGAERENAAPKIINEEVISVKDAN